MRFKEILEMVCRMLKVTKKLKKCHNCHRHFLPDMVTFIDGKTTCYSCAKKKANKDSNKKLQIKEPHYCLLRLVIQRRSNPDRLYLLGDKMSVDYYVDGRVISNGWK